MLFYDSLTFYSEGEKSLRSLISLITEKILQETKQLQINYVQAGLFVSNKDDSTQSVVKTVNVLTSAVPFCPAGGDGGAEDPGSSSQQVHRLFGVHIPVKNRVVSGHDHHERRRPEVRSHPLTH